MSTDHNRIKVADLEKNQRDKILTTNNNGEIEFSDISTIKIDSYNALDQTVAGKALDARQGKVIKDLINNINAILVSDNTNLNTLQELVDAIEVVQNSLNTILVNDLTSGGTTKALTAEMGKALQSSKVDKITGKSLLSDTEITRLGTLSNYTHPANHPASIITQDTNNRFVTDTEKASWNAKQNALGFVPENTSNKNVASGYAGLGADGKLISSQLPSITLNDTFVIASQAAMLALTVQTGDIAVRTDLSKSFILKGSNPTVLADWQELLTPTSAVTTVFGRNGAVASQAGDYSADQISETATRKFQSANQQTFNDATSSIQTQLNNKQVAGSYEPSFSKNTGFNKNFGSVAGTVIEGNDPRIINGQTAFGWGNHTGLYPALNGSGANGNWGINITGNAYTSSYSTLLSRSNDTGSLISSFRNTISGNKSWHDGNNEVDAPVAGQWFNVESMRHSNPSNVYGTQQAYLWGGGNPDMYLRQVNNDTFGPWARVLNSTNYSSYANFSDIVSSGSGFQTTAYAVNSRNRIWSFGNADGYGLSYFQGSSGQYGTDSIGIHFGNSTNAESKFIFAGNGDLITTGLTTSSALGVAQTTGTGQGISLYSSAVNGMPSYGLMFATTSNYGGHGSVNGDWATYFTMAGATNRGWVFRSTNTNVASISATGVFTGSNFVGPLSGNANTATSATRVSFSDGPRNLSDRLPNAFARTVNFDFVNAATVGGSGNYGGVMTFAPWDGLTASTGDSSYQLAFRNESGINGSGLPGLRLRKGIDTTWGSWYDMIHSGNYNSFSAFSGAITGASLTVTGDVTAFSDARVKENIRPISEVIKRIKASRGVVYDRIDTKQKDNIGFIAQELEETFPELVLTREDGTKAVKYQNAVAVLFEAIKEQQQIIESLNKDVKLILEQLNLKS